MKEKSLVQIEKAEKQRPLTPPARTREQEPPASPAASTREAAQYVSGRGRSTATALRALQRTVGNARVQRALGSQTEASDKAHPGLAEELARERDGGQPLPAHVQARMERDFGDGHDFSGVRVHTAPQADALNRRLRARAFTAGQDIFFREGEFAPDTASGQRLLSHELAHVVQQSEGAVDSAASTGEGVVVGAPDDAFEQAADRVAEAVASGTALAPTQAAPSVQQQAEEEEGEKEEEEEPIQTKAMEEEAEKEIAP